jgi:DNA repair photolyase
MAQEDLREKGGVTYRELRARSLLNKCDAPRMPFTWTVNPYRGCAMGCRYCYATYTHEFMGIATPEDFHSLVYVKVGAEEETAKRLAGVVRRGERIALGTATDPYQPGEAESRVTRRFLEMVARHRGVRLGITTKGALVLRDVDLLQRIASRSDLSVHVSLMSPRADLLRRLEPWAPPPEVRLEMMRRLVEAGVETWLGLAPILPAITDTEGDLDRLLGLAREAGVRRLFSNVLFLRSPTREKYLRFVAAEFPRYLEAYQKAYDRRVYLGGAYRRRVHDMLDRLKQRHGFDAPAREEDASSPARQLLLFD